MAVFEPDPIIPEIVDRIDDVETVNQRLNAEIEALRAENKREQDSRMSEMQQMQTIIAENQSQMQEMRRIVQNMQATIKEQQIQMQLILERTREMTLGRQKLTSQLEQLKTSLTGNQTAESASVDESPAVQQQEQSNFQAVADNFETIFDASVRSQLRSIYDSTCDESITIGRNKISDQGALALAQCLQVNINLKTLNINDNPIFDKGLQYLILIALESNVILQQLSLCNCSISDEGGEAIAEMLKVNKTLTS